MASLRRHLASLGLAVVVCHTVVQILVPAALCCQKPVVGSTARAEAHDCCPAGSHQGQICPMHAKNAGKSTRPSGDNCSATPLVDLHDMLMTLSSGGVVPPIASFAIVLRSETAPFAAAPVPSVVVSAPPGPPPRA
jgi:hypothetical protein